MYKRCQTVFFNVWFRQIYTNCRDVDKGLSIIQSAHVNHVTGVFRNPGECVWVSQSTQPIPIRWFGRRGFIWKDALIYARCDFRCNCAVNEMGWGWARLFPVCIASTGCMKFVYFGPSGTSYKHIIASRSPDVNASCFVVSALVMMNANLYTKRESIYELRKLSNCGRLSFISFRYVSHSRIHIHKNLTRSKIWHNSFALQITPTNMPRGLWLSLDTPASTINSLRMDPSSDGLVYIQYLIFFRTMPAFR